MNKIFDGEDVIAIKGNINQIKKGEWTFSPIKDLPLQWGLGLFSKGHRFVEHTHKIRERQKKYATHELVLVLDGELKAVIYDSNRVMIAEVYLYSGDYLVTFGGSHGYEVRKENTHVLEVKNGPFATVEEDKVKWK